jgi:4-hydroxybenzoate polyprenyltransferase
VEEPVFQPERRCELSKHAELVDMEGYAVARVCEEHNIPCSLIKGVTDFGDREGREDIQRHIDSVSVVVAEAVLRIADEVSNAVEDKKTGPSADTEQEAPYALIKRLHSFTKIEHTIFSLPLLFAGAWLGKEASVMKGDPSGSAAAGGMPPLRTLLLIALVGLGARTFGMAVNRIMDRKSDAENPRTKHRELPSGKLSLMQGYAVALAGIGTYFIGCALLGETVLRFSFVPLIPLSLYSLLKRFTPLCHYGIGICLATAPLGAFVAVTDSVAFTPDVILLALFTLFWISGFDIIYALSDIDFDRAYHVRSIPAAVGPVGAQWIAALTHLASFSMLVWLWISIGGGALSFAALLTAAGAFGAAYLPGLPLHVRFFPVSAVAGVAGALVVLLGGFAS